jgi:predicted ribosome quality control (RQC) complex YloA/Tae2 family protein
MIYYLHIIINHTQVINKTRMKIQEIFFPSLKVTITFYIGENKQDNFDMIDKCDEEDLWFHSKNESSCHVVALVSNMEGEKVKKQKMHTIISQGALLCKQNTSKLSKTPKVEIIYTKIKNITKTDKIGCVLTSNIKEIIV